MQACLAKLAGGRRDLESNDPNVYAVILKHFFRHLPEPLCRDFVACMAICNDYAVHDTSASLRRRRELNVPLQACFSESTLVLLEALWASMSEPSRQCCFLLFRLFNTLLLTERATKMSLDNLALVFVNGVLRDPDPSAMSALASQPSCQRFVTYLFTFVIECKCGDDRLLNLHAEPKQQEDVVTPLPLMRSSADDCSVFGGATVAVAATKKRGSVTGVPSGQPISSSGEDLSDGSKKVGSMEDRVSRLMQRKQPISEEPSTWGELFEVKKKKKKEHFV